MAESKQPLVTVVATCFNYADFIGEAIRSVYSQTYTNIQLIVVNDGSSDNSREVITNLQKEHKFEFIDHENIGVIKSIEGAVEKTKGEYFIHLGADDIMPDNYIEELVKVAMEHRDTSIFYTDLVNLDTGEVVVRPPEFSKELLKHYNYIHGTSMVSTRLMKNIKYDQNLKGLGLEDWDFFLTAVLQGEKAMYVDNTYLRYRRHKTLRSRSQRRRSDAKGLKAIRYILEKNIEKHPDEMSYFSWIKDNMSEAIKYLDTYKTDLDKANSSISSKDRELARLKGELESIRNSRGMKLISLMRKVLFFWRSA